MPRHEHGLVFDANHVFLELPEGRFLMDTGCPVTFGRTGHVTYGDIQRPISASFGPFNMEGLHQLPGVRCDGLVGMDLLGIAPVLWDGLAGKALVGHDLPSPGAREAAFRIVRGLPVFDAHLAGLPARCAFDTGAQYGYLLDGALREKGIPDGEFGDYNPAIGHFTSRAWLLAVEFAGIHFTERFGFLNHPMNMDLHVAGADALIGCSWMPARQIWFLPDRNSVFVA